MPRPIEAIISQSAIRHNLGVVRKFAPQARVWGVVKANAYGHGVARTVPALTAADGLALLDLAEAQLVRTLGYAHPVLLLEGCFSGADLTVASALHLAVVVHCDDQIQMLARSKSLPIDVYLKMNSGMSRLGFAPERYAEAHARLRALASVGRITLMTHFACADTPGGNDSALQRFAAATAGLPGERSLSNSAATLLDARAHADWVRPGIMLYGSTPVTGRSAASFDLQAAMTLRSRLIAIQDLAAGETVGYGARFVAERAMRIGIVACGYADGYPRTAPTGTPILVGVTPTQVVGTVSMDMITVDLSALPDAQIGTPVELWGETISVDDVARAAGTVGYELLCALAQRVPVREVG